MRAFLLGALLIPFTVGLVSCAIESQAQAFAGATWNTRYGQVQTHTGHCAELQRLIAIMAQRAEPGSLFAPEPGCVTRATVSGDVEVVVLRRFDAEKGGLVAYLAVAATMATVKTRGAR